ncbi:MAG: FtsH protease activity modulator HflK [Pseudomonadota bacterium]
MAWNEPGNDSRGPWDKKQRNQGPPDLDEVARQLQEKVSNLFGGRKQNNTSNSDNGGSKLPNSGPLLALAGIIGAGFLAYQSFYTIQPAERGVVQRFGAYHSVTAPGPHFKIPLIDTVDTVNVDQVNKFVHSAQMLTKDENIADVRVEVQFRIQDAPDYLFQDANPNGTIRGAVESSLREVIGKNNLDQVMTDNRIGIALDVQKGTQAMLDLYRTGLFVTNINIQDARPPEPVQDAFADAIKAREDKERLQNQAQTYANDVVPRARGNAARQVEDAKAYKTKVVAEAQGESERFLALLAEYQKAPGVTRERLYLETMQTVLQSSGKVLLDVKEGNNLTYLPLDRLMRAPTQVQNTPPYATDSMTTEPTLSQRLDNARRALTRDRGTR